MECFACCGENGREEGRREGSEERTMMMVSEVAARRGGRQRAFRCVNLNSPAFKLAKESVDVLHGGEVERVTTRQGNSVTARLGNHARPAAWLVRHDCPRTAAACLVVRRRCIVFATRHKEKDERSLAWLRHTSRMHTTTDTLHHRNARAAWHGRAGRASGLAWVVLLLPLAKTRAHPLSYTPRRLHSPREPQWLCAWL